MKRCRLITIAFSHYCEKARWALDRLAVPYDEEPHLPVFHWTASFRSGGRRTVPVLISDERVLPDSTDILLYLDERAPERAKLYPEEPGERRRCTELEDLFDRRLGPATRRLAYYHLLPSRELTLEMLRGPRSGPSWERRVAGPAYPVLSALLRRGLRIDRAGAERSRQVIDEMFEDVGARLRGGRPYLLGDRFSAADLTFAALAAPVVQPPEYGFELPALERSPREAADLVRRQRHTEAGRFALRLYETERKTVIRGAA